MKIRKLDKEDLTQRVEWMNTPSVYENMHFVPPITLENTYAWFEKNKKINNRIDFAFEDETGKLVAMGGLTNIDYVSRKAEFYVFVNPGRHKEGFGTLATLLLCKYGFHNLNLNKIYLLTNATNMGARKTYEKVGFKLEGIHREELVTSNGNYDRLYFGMLSSEFNDSTPAIKFESSKAI